MNIPPEMIVVYTLLVLLSLSKIRILLSLRRVDETFF